jgi:hypothetical protein
MAILFLILDLESSGLKVDVLLNGIPIVEERSLSTTRRSLKVNGWVVEGDNVLEARFEAPHPGLNPPSAPRATITLRRAAAGPSTAGDETLVAYAWSAKDQPLAAGIRTTVLTRHLSLHAPKAWSWVKAPPTPQLNDQDRTDIVALLRSVEQALSNKRSRDVVALQTLSLTEQAEANGSDPAPVLASYAGFLDARMAAPGWHVEPLAAERLQFVPLAGGRIIHIVGVAGAPPLVARTDDSSLQIDPYVSKVDGRWTVVR